MIFSRHSVLKRGCSTWNREQMPEEEFHARLAAARAEMARRDLDALILYGDNYAFADLCYLSNYFPKVRGGLALVPRQGAMSLLLNIGSRDVPFAKTLTWVDDVRASNQLGRDGAALVREKGFAEATVGFADSGRGFSVTQLEELKKGLPGARWRASDDLLAPMRLTKSRRELAALAEAGRLLGEICAEAGAFIRHGRLPHEVIADLDRLARDKGVEDIRIMAGEERLNPPGAKFTEPVGEHWAVYLAIQHDRYWADAGRTYILSADSRLGAPYEKARQTVTSMAAQLGPGHAVAAVTGAARMYLGDAYDAARLYGLGNGIGLSQWEAPFLDPEDGGAATVGASELKPGMTMALRAVCRSENKLVLFGNSFAVTANGAVSLVK